MFAAVMAAAALAGAAAAPAAEFRFLSAWGGPGRGPGQFDFADGVSVDPAGNVYVADRENNRVQKFTWDGRHIASLGRNGGDGSLGTGPGELSGPFSVATDGWGDVYVVDSRNNRVQKFDSTGRFLRMWGRNGGDGSRGSLPGELAYPRGIEVDRWGTIYVSDHDNHRVQKFTRDGELLAVWGRNGGDGSSGSGPGEFWEPRGLAIDARGNVYVAEKLNHRVQKLAPDGRFLGSWGKDGGAGGGERAIGSGDGEFNLPYDVAIDSRGRVYVTDTSNTRVQVFDTTGRFIAKWGGPGSGPGQFFDPYGVGVDCRDNVYVTEDGNDRVQRFGDPSRPPPRCPPRLAIDPAGSTLRRGSVTLRVECDLPCTARLGGEIALPGGARAPFRQRTRELPPARRTELALRLTARGRAAVRRALGRRARLRARIRGVASGFGGRSPRVTRRIALRR
jgi:DNA-binding beta-propeller fold protein YncE